jgi:hypothetical protein
MNMKKLTGREPARGSGIEPAGIWACQPKVLSGMGRFQQAARKGRGGLRRGDGLRAGHAGPLPGTPPTWQEISDRWQPAT